MRVGCPEDGRVIGHVFFQRRGAAVYGFSTAVNASFDGHGYSVAIVLNYVTYASQMPGVVRARVGRGQNSVTKRFLQRLKKHERQLSWRVDPDGWVTFRRVRRTRARPDGIGPLVPGALILRAARSGRGEWRRVAAERDRRRARVRPRGG